MYMVHSSPDIKGDLSFFADTSRDRVSVLPSALRHQPTEQSSKPTVVVLDAAETQVDDEKVE